MAQARLISEKSYRQWSPPAGARYVRQERGVYIYTLGKDRWLGVLRTAGGYVVREYLGGCGCNG